MTFVIPDFVSERSERRTSGIHASESTGQRRRRIGDDHQIASQAWIIPYGHSQLAISCLGLWLTQCFGIATFFANERKRAATFCKKLFATALTPLQPPT